jgi:hypothetical protein
MTKEFPDVEGTRTFVTVFTKLGHALNALRLFAGNICSVNLSTPGILKICRTCSGVWLCLYTRQDDCLGSEMRLVTVREDGSNMVPQSVYPGQQAYCYNDEYCECAVQLEVRMSCGLSVNLFQIHICYS